MWEDQVWANANFKLCNKVRTNVKNALKCSVFRRGHMIDIMKYIIEAEMWWGNCVIPWSTTNFCCLFHLRFAHRWTVPLNLSWLGSRVTVIRNCQTQISLSILSLSWACISKWPEKTTIVNTGRESHAKEKWQPILHFTAFQKS